MSHTQTALRLLLCVAATGCASAGSLPASAPPSPESELLPIGYADTPKLPMADWRVHDVERPRPEATPPGTALGAPPADAIVLFDGTDLQEWIGADQRPAQWRVADGYVEVTNTGDILTKRAFGDVQLHIEWRAPAPVQLSSQKRGNSGVFIAERYEVQVLDSYQNKTYADGQAGAIYGQYPPLVNASRPPGEWQSYDIIFKAPKFEGEKLVSPAYATVLHNGILVQNHVQLIGSTAHKEVAKYEPHGKAPLRLQDHQDNQAVRFRNIWVREL